PSADLPFTTLTYAQSLDSMLSLSPGLRTTLSGPQTKSLTHYLRLHHDAILIGAGTAIPDDPGLNCRYPGVQLESQPRPVIVDPRGRWEAQGSRVLELAGRREGREPWVVGRGSGAEGRVDEVGVRRVWVEEVGDDGRIPWVSILKRLKREGINSVMIEGGASVISALLAFPELVDAVVVTIAPTWLGSGGVAVTPGAKQGEGGERVNAARLGDTVWRQFGADAVVCGRL
ncbi:bacterial bifunctional deaminase-reductase, partial [Teratosphaeria nubilosa]